MPSSNVPFSSSLLRRRGRRREEKREMEGKRGTVVLYPSPDMGHLISMVELGKRFLQFNPPFSITVLLTQASFNTGSTSPYVQSVQSSFPSISFYYLPPLSLPSNSTTSPHHLSLLFRLLRLNNPLVHRSLLSISHSSAILAILYDVFCHPVLDVAAQFNIPSYIFFTSPASCLAVFLHFPTVHRLTNASFKDLHDTPLHFPGNPPILASDMPLPMLDRNDEAYDGLVSVTLAIPKATGILVNSFDSLELKALKAISDGECLPDAPTPPVYCVGPLIAKEKGEDGAECLAWLDSQPSRSVVFLCFGSLGLFSAKQIKEIAVGLEKSEQRFLWVVRSPHSEDPSQRFLAPLEPDLDALLPSVFLERTKERGMVVKSWAPQVKVLRKDSVGGFVTHCGWNSVLEALCAGVPMVAWPLYAEQRLNRVTLVEELKLAMKLEGQEKGWVTAEEVEKKVRGLMESEEGKGLRERTVKMMEGAEAALSEGGSSHSAITELTQQWKRG